MQAIQSILVDIDATATAHPALDRALILSRQSGARVKLVDVVDIPAAGTSHFTPAMRELILTSRREQLLRIAASIEHSRVDADVLVGRPATALIREVLQSGHDLLLRSRVQDPASHVLKMHDSVDMELFRQCPCPVWAEAPGESGTPPKIVAAVHANPEDPAEQSLNKKIIELGQWVAQLQRGSLTILQAWTAFGESMLRIHLTSADFTEYLNNTERKIRDDLRALANSLGPNLALTRIEVGKGPPEAVIPEFVLTEGTDLVVMGTLARTGLSAFLIGNTAERLLQRLSCSVVTVKPDDFVSPVKP